MVKQGTRPWYVILITTHFDDINTSCELITQNPKEAVDRFKWLYYEWSLRDYRNDEGDTFYNGRDLHINTQRLKDGILNGNYWYDDDEGGYTGGTLITVYSNVFTNNWNTQINDTKERMYKEWLERHYRN